MEKSNLEKIRHSLAHLLGSAVLELYPDSKLTLGPAIENGFYYDIDVVGKITLEDLPKIEAKMRELVVDWTSFERQEVDSDKAMSIFLGNEFKNELITDVTNKGEKLTLYTSGNFTDLCRGGHVENPKEDIDMDAWKLDRVAGAYWRGDEKNKMLTRIYGLAFENKSELDGYLHLREEAEKRDHKKLGKQLGLFMFHETAPGMPYWLPKGLILYKELENYWRREHARLDYQEICSPLVNKAELWKTSGHWDHYQEDMFIADMGENEVYGIKPMNCPNAMVVFKSMQVSYKDLPIRLSDTDRLHRYERSGTLNGLLRCRSFQQDDAHNFISEDMIESEYESIMEICKNFYGIFGLEYSFRLGTRPESFMGEVATWDKAEDALRKVLDKSGKTFTIAEGDGAFYGPKIDILMKDALGREWQMGTMQLDFQQPLRFDLSYTDNNGKKQTPVVIHRVIYGSLERFIGIITEHYAGAFPIWLSPVQVAIIPVSEKFLEYSENLKADLLAKNIRVICDKSNETLGKKIRENKTAKIPYLIVVGEKEINSGSLTIEKRDGEKVMLSKDEFITQLISDIQNLK